MEIRGRRTCHCVVCFRILTKGCELLTGIETIIITNRRYCHTNKVVNVVKSFMCVLQPYDKVYAFSIVLQ